ncbi:MAG: hypothetical protein AAF614_07030 [Chloroflexota bacterium]
MKQEAILQPGITHLPLSEKPFVFAPEIDWNHFEKMCFFAAQKYGGKYLRLSGSYPDNFRQAWFSHKHDSSKRVLAMISIYYPLMGFLSIDGRDFASVDADGIPERVGFAGGSFASYPIFLGTDLTYWFSQNSYRVLSKEELLEPLEFEQIQANNSNSDKRELVLLKNEHKLRSQEIVDLYNFYPRVRTIAEAIFGSFD